MGDGLVLVNPQALNASTTKMCKRIEITRFIGNLRLRNLLRFGNYTALQPNQPVHLAAVILVERNLGFE
jgi:hypothetical protein